MSIHNAKYNHNKHYIELIYSLPPIAVGLHRVRNLLEARNVRTDDQARQDFARITFLHAELSASLKGRPEDALHDPLEPAVDVLKLPGESGRVLRHLKTRDSDTTAVARLARSVPDGLLDTLGTSGLEDVNRLLGAALEREEDHQSLVYTPPMECANVPC
jgi:hypothetical protein